jgi:hypothetical protein
MIRIVGIIVGLVLVWMLVIGPFLSCYGEEQDLIDAQFKYNGVNISHHEARKRLDASSTAKVEKDLNDAQSYQDSVKYNRAVNKAATG